MLLVGLLPGCPGHMAWTDVDELQTVDQLREFIAENPGSSEASKARNRIAELEYQAAVESGTRYAFRLFLERHPESPRALDARRKLEKLDFERASASGSLDALNAFLRRYPDGRLAGRARRMRGELLCRRWLDCTDAADLAAALDRHPELPCRAELDQRLKRLRFERAAAANRADLLLEFSETYRGDPLAVRAEQRLLELEVEALLVAARFERARRWTLERAGADNTDALLARIEAARAAWERATFDPQPGAAVARRRLLDRLAAATGRLRQPRAALQSAPVQAVDPRERWLAADRFGLLTDEAAADVLLELLGDPYLEVRRRALNSLRAVVERLGPVRGQVWIVQQRKRLTETGQASVPLFKRAALAEIAGQPGQALPLYEKLVRESERPDLLGMARAARLSELLGLDREAVVWSRRFCEQADRFAQQRMRGWSQQQALRESDRGWLSLRQLHGLLVLWRDVLGPFETGPRERARLDDRAAVLGPWLERAESDVRGLVRWLRDEESRWARTHPGYIPSAAPAAPAPGSAPPARLAADLDLLLLAGGRRARPTVAWTACCHPRAELRLAAGLHLVLDSLMRRWRSWLWQPRPRSG
jgi:hypothetical protein